MYYEPLDIINFGMHKGKTIREVIKSDINYIVWCLIQIDDFKLSDSSIVEFIDNKENVYLNHSRLNDYKAALIAFGLEEGDIEKEKNRNIAEIINKIGKKK